MELAVYPGSFDPLTNGHLDIIQRAAAISENLIVSVVRNPNKTSTFTEDERVEMIKVATADLPNVQVTQFEGLLINHVESLGAKFIIRGLRAITDFEYEFQMALMNRKLNSEIDTLFLMTKSTYSYLSSSVVKEVFKLGGDISCLVPPNVLAALYEKYPGVVTTKAKGDEF